jgi:hypothetical protein
MQKALFRITGNATGIRSGYLRNNSTVLTRLLIPLYVTYVVNTASFAKPSNKRLPCVCRMPYLE